MKRSIAILVTVSLFIAGCTAMTPEQREEQALKRISSSDAKVVSEIESGSVTYLVIRDKETLMCVIVNGTVDVPYTTISRKIDFSQAELLDRTAYEKEIIDRCKP